MLLLSPEAQAQAQKLIPFVCYELNKIDGETWTWHPREGDGWYLGDMIAANGERFGIGIEDGSKLVILSHYGQQVSGQYWSPDDYNVRQLGVSDPRPRMSAAKTDKQIATEIVRRFLPDYRTIRAEYLRQYQAATAYRDRADHLAAQLQEASQGILTFYRKDHRNNEMGCYINAAQKGVMLHGTAKVYDESVRFEITVSSELALKIAALLAG